MNNKSKLQKLLVILILMSVVFGSLIIYQNLEQKNKVIKELTDRSDGQQKQISDLKKNIDELELELNHSEAGLTNERTQKEKLIQEIFSLKKTAKSSYAVIGVNSEGKGSVIPLDVVIKSGNGSLFIDVSNVLFDESLQSSAQTAVKVAEEIAKVNSKDKDILVSIHAPVSNEKAEIGGGSAGAAMTIAIVAAMEGRNISRDVLITGTIEEYHTIGKIGAAREKGVAVKDAGAKMFIVPIGQNVSVPGLEVKEAFLIEDAMKIIAPAN
jgi:ATP-dependent Lon protease